MKKLAGLVFSFMALFTHAQNSLFLKEGRIEFERKVNLHASLIITGPGSEDYKKSIPQFKTSIFNLFFRPGETLYLPGKANTENFIMGPQPAEDNIVYSRPEKSFAVARKKVFNSIYLIKGEIKPVKWKITGEKRIIAGFDCIRANAIIQDSVYAVAFFSEQIISAGGPESFCGLPGMILGLVLPHKHISWFATKVFAEPVNELEPLQPTEGLKIDTDTFKQKIRTVTANQNPIYSWEYISIFF